jgi:lysophospholipase L1-like esterase
MSQIFTTEAQVQSIINSIVTGQRNSAGGLVGLLPNGQIDPKFLVDSLAVGNGGAITTADTPPTDAVERVYFPSEDGTYTNFDGITVTLSDGLNLIIGSDGNGFTKVVVPIDLAGYATTGDIADFLPKTGTTLTIGAGVNLLDPDSVQLGIINADGSLTASTIRVYSSFILVKPLTGYYMGSQSLNEGYYNVAEYDIDFNVVAGGGTNTRAQTFTTKATTRFVVVTVRPNMLDSFIVKEGVDAAAFVAFVPKRTLDPRLEMFDENIPNSILRKNDLVITVAGGLNLFDLSTVRQGIIDKDGIFTTNAQRVYSSFILVEPSTTYHNRSASLSESFYNLAEYDENFDHLPGTGTDTRLATFTTSANTRFIIVTVRPAMLADYMFVKGSVGVSFEPFQPKILISPTMKILPESIPDIYLKKTDTLDQENLSFAEISFGRNLFNINDPENELGKFITTSGGIGTNAIYNATHFIPVEAGETYRLSYKHNIAWYDASKTFISGSASSDTNRTQTAPAGAVFLRCTVLLASWDQFQVEIGTVSTDFEPWRQFFLFKNVKAEISENVPDQTLIFLPPEIYVAVGRTIEIYNAQCFYAGNLGDYHFFWSGVGFSMKRKWTMTGVAPGTHTLTLQVYDKNRLPVATAQTTVKVVAATIDTPFSVCPIGDSLTNAKAWLGEVRSLSANAISWTGTRFNGTTIGSALTHEGRSGWRASDYLINASYTFDANGEAGIDGRLQSLNPFFNPNTSQFDFAYYKSNYNKNPDRILLFLGTNGIAINPAPNAGNIKAIVDGIRATDATIKIYVSFTLFRSNQDGIGKQFGTDGFIANTRWKLEEDFKVFALQLAVYDLLKNYNNLFFVPLSLCHDSEFNYGAVQTPVNPRAAQVEFLPVESVHPQNQGYMQIADIVFSVLAGT